MVGFKKNKGRAISAISARWARIWCAPAFLAVSDPPVHSGRSGAHGGTFAAPAGPGPLRFGRARGCGADPTHAGRCAEPARPLRPPARPGGHSPAAPAPSPRRARPGPRARSRA